MIDNSCLLSTLLVVLIVGIIMGLIVGLFVVGYIGGCINAGISIYKWLQSMSNLLLKKWSQIKLAERTSSWFSQPSKRTLGMERMETKEIGNLISHPDILQAYGTFAIFARMFRFG